MAVAYDDIYTDGATDLSAGATWAANGKVLLADQTQAILTTLDVKANAIDLVHVIGGAPQIVSAAGGTASFTIDNTYVTDPNVVWQAGGYLKASFITNACPQMVVANGTVIIEAGTVTKLVVTGGSVTVESGATVTELIVSGGRCTVHSAIATVRQSGGRVDADVRMGSTAYYLSGGSAYVENISGSACTLLNLEASGTWHPMAGNVATLNRNGGTINYDAAVRSLTLGSTAFTNYGGTSPSSTGLVAVSNLTDYAAYSLGSQSGQQIP